MPYTYIGCPGDDITPANTGFATATPGDSNCPEDIMVTYSDEVFTNTACEVLIKRSWTAEYMKPTQIPLSSTIEQIIWLVDSDGPHITNCPGSITPVDTNPVYIWTEPTVTDCCGVDTVYSDFQSGHSFPVGTTIVTYTAVDNCGNTSTCSFSVTVQQCSATLKLECPKKYNGCPLDDISVYVLGEATVSISSYDCGTPILSYRDTIIKDKVCNKKIERIWTAVIPNTDISAECRQVIKLKDDTAPTIDGCPEDVTLDISEATYYWTEPTAWDDCEIVFFGSDVSNGSTFPLGTTTVTYLAEDGCGESATCSFTVTIEEKICVTDLEIICPPKYVGCRHESPLPYNTGEPTVEYSHNNCDDIIVTYEDYIIANNKCKLKFDRIWTAKVPGTDLYVRCRQRINLNDDLPPVIDRCPEDVTLDISEATYHWYEPIALDNCKIASFESDISNGSTFPLGTTTVTYVAKDVCGESATCSFTVTVIEKDCVTGLKLICPPKYVACRHESPWPENTGEPSIKYSYNNCNEIVVTYKDEIIVNNSCKLKFDRIWTAKVPGTHIYAQCTQRINLKDNEAPVISYCPSDVTIYSEMSKYTWDEPTASDNCSYVTLSSSVPNGYDFPIGTTEVVITATDECGNESTCSFKVRVKEHPGSGLLISCPDDIVIECGDNLHYDKWPLPEINTSCTKCDHDYIDNFIYMGQYNGHRYFCSKYAATWEDAHAKAQYLGGHLAIINSEEENHYLSNLITVRSAYIGLTDKEYEGNFKWVNGESVTYSNWYPGQPNNYRGLQNYVELLYNGYWNDQYNYKKLEFIVEFPCVKIEQTKGPHYPNQFTGYSTTIEYKVTDACGNVATCSFDVVKHGKQQLTCPEDIVVDLQYGQYEVYVNWEEPTVETCCAGVTDLKHYIPGFVYMGSRGGHDYYCSEYHATWHDAQKDCENHGGYLAVIDNYEENNMLANFLTVQSAYIGLSDHHDEGYFQWINNAPLFYTNWYPKQPNNYGVGQHYVEMLRNGQWNDQYTYKKREFIMEIPGGVEVHQTAGPPNGSSFKYGTITIKYKAKDACGNHSTCSFTVTVNSAPNNGNCPVGDIDSYDYWIESVQLGDFKNVSGNNNGYADFSYDCIIVHRGDTRELKLSPGFHYSVNPVYWSIFIDWNDDGYYKNSELIAKGKGQGVLKGYFKFAEHLPLGKFSIRITMNPYGYHLNGCEPLSKGEIEDYCLHIKGKSYVTDIGKANKEVRFDPVVLQSYDLVSDETAFVEKENAEGIEEISVFPNPFIDQIEIQGANVERISIFSPNGELIRSLDGNPESNARMINLDNVAKGLYFIYIEKNNGVVELKKIIKQSHKKKEIP